MWAESSIALLRVVQTGNGGNVMITMLYSHTETMKCFLKCKVDS